VDKVTPNAVTLSWDKPTNDGGSKIDGYVVEVKPKGGDWTDATPYPVKENEFTVPRLKEGEEYQFRVRAVNEAGDGTPSAPTGPVVAEKPTEKPTIDASGIKEIKVHAGEVIKISIPIKGWPVPTTSWELGDTPLVKGGRTQMETTDDAVILTIKDAERKDSGPYTVKLRNPAGTAEAEVRVIVLDKPSPPQGPLEVLKTTPTEITLQWKPPKDNGGSPIEKYVLEKKPKGGKWQKVPGHIGPDETEVTAKNLDEGEEYEFRVTAVNENGESDPLVTQGPVKAKHPFDPPGKPGDPECTGTTEDSITLAWDPPTRDGGKPIKGYILEKKEKDGKRWTRVTPNEITDNEFTVKGLTEGKPYEFRVAAVNEAGPGQWAQIAEAIKPAPPPCAPRALLDPSLSEVSAMVGEPYRIRIPFKGSPTNRTVFQWFQRDW
jgi:predicted RNA-binding protein with TRAM domain